MPRVSKTKVIEVEEPIETKPQRKTSATSRKKTSTKVEKESKPRTSTKTKVVKENVEEPKPKVKATTKAKTSSKSKTSCESNTPPKAKTPESSEDDVALEYKKQWITISQKIAEQQEVLKKLENERTQLVTLISQLVENEKQTPVVSTTNTTRVVENQLDIESDEEISGLDTSSSESEAEEEDVSEVSLSDSSDSLSESESEPDNED